MEVVVPSILNTAFICLARIWIDMFKQILLAIVASVIILAASITPNLVYATSLTDMFCAAYRLGLAQSPQQSVMCGLLGSGQLLSQYQQNQQQGVNQNPCPSGTQLVGLQCQVINGLNSAATTAQLCQTQNAVLTPAVANIVPASRAAKRGTVVTLSGITSTPSTVSTGFQSSATCSTATGVITTYNWLQTSGVPVTLSGLNTPTISFATPTNATTLVFSLHITDSNQVTSNQATATVQVP
jgi:hypothetical protein